METSEHRITLDNMARGAAIELFDMELKKVLANLDDLNRDPKAVREINLTVKFTPTETPGIVVLDVQTKKKMPARNGVRTTMIFEKDPHTEIIHAREFIQEKQVGLWDVAEAAENKVRKIRPITE